MSNSLGFASRLAQVFAQFGHLCVGIDPHPFLLREWGFDDDARGVRELSLRTLDACVNRVGLIKPQVAFYERYGSAGYAILEELIRRARAADILVIADAKRGDIGTTMDAYNATWLGAGSPLESDAVTVSPYLGVASLDGTFALANNNNKGVFVLAATSNPEGASVQQGRSAAGDVIAAHVCHEVSARSVDARDPGSFGVVLGATLRLENFGIDTSSAFPMPILAPGFGAQGAAVADATRIFGALAQNLIVAQTRSILSAGPDGITEAIRREAGETADSLG